MTRYVPPGSKKTPGPVIKVKFAGICMVVSVNKFYIPVLDFLWVVTPTMMTRFIPRFIVLLFVIR